MKLSVSKRDVPGISDTKYGHFPAPSTGMFVPTSCSYLREYDEKTGF